MRAAGWDLPHRPAASAQELARREKTLLRMWPAGASYQEIADELGMTLAGAAGLVARLRARGADLPRRRAPAQRDAPKRDRVLELWADGRTLA